MDDARAALARRVRGLDLSRRFYFEAVRPILDREFPRLEHAAALVGWSSEVLGFDDETSQDHEWGPRLQLFLRDVDAAPAIERRLAEELPVEFAGVPTNFGPTDEPGTVKIAAVDAGPVAHRVETLVYRDYLRSRLGTDPLERFTVLDWLVTPTQRLLETTAGEVFVDRIGEVTRAREVLAWYPHDVWLLVMSGHWRRIAQLEHLHGRTGSRGDELGSRLIAASLVRDLMRLALLQERRYPPYPKWLGSAYALLDRPEGEALHAALGAAGWREREDALVTAYELVAERHNALAVTEPVDPAARQFYGRPFRVLFADRLVDALRAAITGPAVRALDHLAGSIDAVSDSTDVLTRPRLWRRLGGLYDRTQSDQGDGSDGM
ncbi:MAG: DUF4037 domain-containing protein [Actinomycetota bacterium]|nr:DUF4037 domain-containing protein [Actinomycetota bacterium]